MSHVITAVLVNTHLRQRHRVFHVVPAPFQLRALVVLAMRAMNLLTMLVLYVQLVNSKLLQVILSAQHAQQTQTPEAALLLVPATQDISFLVERVRNAQRTVLKAPQGTKPARIAARIHHRMVPRVSVR